MSTFPWLKNWLVRRRTLPSLGQVRPQAGDPPIFWFNGERQDLINETVARSAAKAQSGSASLEYALNEVANDEIRRLESQRDTESELRLGRWKSLTRRVSKMSDSEKQKTLTKVIGSMTEDIAGNFDARVYAFAQKSVPRLLTGIMKPSAIPEDLFGTGGESPINNLLITEGHIELIRKLQHKGTLVFVPTHSSNLDSVALGYALIRNDLTPVVYGAGKNLFSNPIVSFFMHNLGAYRVDRRVRAALYKDVLKTYSSILLERGYHSLFFPGGTRSRSGMVEHRLKLGLAGTAHEAFSRNTVRGVKRPIWFVPATINYSLVLEAETLIADWLKESGKSQYIIEDDEFSEIERWVSFFRKLAAMRSGCVIRFGRPIDLYGNPIDDDGNSLAPDGHVIDPARYVEHHGQKSLSTVRDAAYTRDLGQVLSEHYDRETVIMGTQLVSHVLFRHLVHASPGVDLFGRMRMRGEVRITKAIFLEELAEARGALLELERSGQARVSEALRTEDPIGLFERVKNAFAGYHRKQALSDADGLITILDPALLLFYQNRLIRYAERIAGTRYAAAAREISRMAPH